MPIEVTPIAGGRVRLWKHRGRVTLSDALSAISQTASAAPGAADAQDLLVYEQGAFADLSYDDLKQIIDAAVAAFPGRYTGAIKCAVVVAGVNWGIAKLFAVLMEQERRITLPVFVFVNCRHALEWLGLRSHEIDRALLEIGNHQFETTEPS